MVGCEVRHGAVPAKIYKARLRSVLAMCGHVMNKQQHCQRVITFRFVWQGSVGQPGRKPGTFAASRLGSKPPRVPPAARSFAALRRHVGLGNVGVGKGLGWLGICTSICISHLHLHGSTSKSFEILPHS